MKVLASFKEVPKGWDEKLFSKPTFGRYEQSSYWAEIAQKIGRGLPIYLQVIEGQTIKASLLCFDQNPGDSGESSFIRRIAARLTGQYRGTLAWHWGPTYYTNNHGERIAATKQLLDWADNYSEEKRLYSIRAYLSEHEDRATVDAISPTFIERGYQEKTWANLLVDLAVDEETLWSQLRSSARKAVKKARKRGLRVAEIKDENDFERLWLDSYRSFESAASRKVFSETWFREFWRHGHGKTHRYFVAQDSSGDVMAVLGMNIFNGVAREFNSAMSPAAYANNLPAQDLLHWEMMVAAKKAGCQIFNLSGVDPNPQTGKARGIRQFKEKWGGKYIEYPRFYKRSKRNLIIFRW